MLCFDNLSFSLNFKLRSACFCGLHQSYLPLQSLNLRCTADKVQRRSESVRLGQHRYNGESTSLTSSVVLSFLAACTTIEQAMRHTRNEDDGTA